MSYTTKQLRRMSAKVETYDNGIKRLVSYNSVIMDYDSEQGVLVFYKDYDFSVTTWKHVHAFLSDVVKVISDKAKVDEAIRTGKLYHLIVVLDTKNFNSYTHRYEVGEYCK